MGTTDEKEIEQTIKTMKDNKALRPNSIRTKILKGYSKTPSKPLPELINFLLNQDKFSRILKVAKVIPIDKIGDKSERDNCWPISLILNKLIRKKETVHERLHSFLEKELHLFEGQFWSKNNWSADALIYTTKYERCTGDKGLHNFVAFLDFKKAFDRVNRDILNKFTHYGIRGQANNWFHSYLTHRVQFLSLNRLNSQPYLTSDRVPQGIFISLWPAQVN